MKTLAAILACIATALPLTTGAQSFPSKPIRLVVSYPPGGGADLMARLVAPRMGEFLGQPVIVENKGGAGGQIAAQEVSRAAPDGHTLMLDAFNHAVNPSLNPQLPYDGIKAFSPVSILVLFPNMLVVHPGFAAKDVKQLVAMAKAQPGGIAFASSGNGSAQHLSGELFKKRAGIEITHVPYKGGGPALNDVIGGQVPMYFANMASGLPHVKAGRLRALAITGGKRSAALPEAPTMAEAGVPGYEVYEWNGIFAPAATPAPVVARLAEAVRHALQDPAVREKVASLGGEIADYDPARATDFVRAQAELWGRVVREGGIKAE